MKQSDITCRCGITSPGPHRANSLASWHLTASWPDTRGTRWLEVAWVQMKSLAQKMECLTV